MTAQTIAEPGTFTTIGTVTLADTTWTVGLDLNAENIPIVSNTWSYTTGPGVNLITFETTDPTTTPKSVLAAAPAALLHRYPHQRPALEWGPRESTTDEPVRDTLVATIADTNGNSVDVYALHHPRLLELSTPNDMSMFVGSKPRRTLFLPVDDMNDVDVPGLFERVRISPRLHG